MPIYLGVVYAVAGAAEHSSGKRIKRGEITGTGNVAADHADRIRIALSLSGTRKTGASAAQCRNSRSYPRHRLESAGSPM